MDEGQAWACVRDPGLRGHAGLKGSGDASRSCPRKRAGLAQLGAMMMMVITIIMHDTSRHCGLPTTDRTVSGGVPWVTSSQAGLIGV